MLRLSRCYSNDEVRQVALPAESGIAEWFEDADLADAFAINLDAASAGKRIDDLAHAVLGDPAPWFRLLLGVRDVLMAGFGVKTSSQLRSAAIRGGSDHIDFFPVLSRSGRELILGEDDRHLDFRLSVLMRRKPEGTGQELVATTVVRCHNRLGHRYLALIKPFHRVVAKANLRRVTRKQWPVSPDLQIGSLSDTSADSSRRHEA